VSKVSELKFKVPKVMEMKVFRIILKMTNQILQDQIIKFVNLKP